MNRASDSLLASVIVFLLWPANSTTPILCFCLCVNIRVMKVASKYAGQGLTFSVASKKDFLSELEEDFGLGMSDGGELPVITIRTRTGHKYTMREEFTYVHVRGTGDLTGAGLVPLLMTSCVSGGTVSP